MHVSQPRKRLHRNTAEGHAVADFAEHLSDIAMEARARLVGKAGEDVARLISMLSSDYEPPPRTLNAPTLPLA